MIVPTNGRIVLFTPGKAFRGAWHDKTQKLPAMICHVWGDRMVNLLVTDSDGIQWPETSVDLVQPGDPPHGDGRYCEWVPYQKGQAAKTEQAGAKASHGVPRLAYSVAEAAKQISISRATMYVMISEGKLATTRIKNRRLVPHEALVAFLKAGAD